MIHILKRKFLKLAARAIPMKRLEITLTIPLTVDDVHRALLLLGTLNVFECQGTSSIREVLAVVPDSQAFAMDLLELLDSCLDISILSESSLFDGLHTNRNSYALQMAIKLLVSQHVMTNFYITLDADVIVVGHLDAKRLFSRGKAMFVPEPQSVHPRWWLGSATILGLDRNAFLNSTFGVTPAVLSTFGAQVATSYLKGQFRDKDWQNVWLESWSSTWWSEYSLYRLVLDVRGLFAELHALPPNGILCNAVWIASQLPWESTTAFRTPHCIFSLVQSTIRIRPSALMSSMAPSFLLRGPHSSPSDPHSSP